MIENNLSDGFYFCLQKYIVGAFDGHYETLACTIDKRRLKRWFRKLKKGFRIIKVKKENSVLEIIETWEGTESGT